MTEPAPTGQPASVPTPLPRWGFGDVFVTLVGSIVLGSAAAAVLLSLEKSGLDSPAAKAWFLDVGLVVPWLCLAGWPLYASVHKGNGPVRDYGLRLTWRSFGTGVACGVGALLTASWTYQIQFKITHHAFDSAVGGVANDVANGSRGALVVLALCTAFGAPVVEELAFRGLTYGSLRKMGQPVVWSVVWTTVLFALFHFEPVRIPVLLVLGAWLGVARAATGSTAASMVAHATVNIPGALMILSLS